MMRKLSLWIQKSKPEVILTSVQTIPEILLQLGYRIPDDLGFVNLSLSEDNGLQAGVNSNWYEIGFYAASEVIELTVANKFGPAKQPKVTFSNPYWVDGLTLPDKQSPLIEIA